MFDLMVALDETGHAAGLVVGTHHLLVKLQYQ